MPITKSDKPRSGKRGRGKPEKEIDERVFNSLCMMQCTIAEICSVMQCDTKTLMLWCKKVHKKKFSELFKERRLGGAASLRRTQWQVAVEDKNVTMLIWLGKQVLGQSDHQQIEGADKTDKRVICRRMGNSSDR